MLPSLAYLPTQHVLTAFELLKSQFPPEALQLYTYFENTYIGERDEFGHLDVPIFPIPMWNDFHLVIYGIPTTTNAVEAWHRTFAVTVACHHPTFQKFCEALIIEQSSVELKQAQYHTGNPLIKLKKKEPVLNYFTKPFLTYLKSIAFKFSF